MKIISTIICPVISLVCRAEDLSPKPDNNYASELLDFAALYPTYISITQRRPSTGSGNALNLSGNGKPGNG